MSQPLDALDACYAMKTRYHMNLRNKNLVALCLAWMFAIPAWTQHFPTRPIKLVVPFAAGGPADVVAREIGQKLGGELGQPIVVENQGGGAGAGAMGTVVRSDADGHTLLFAASGNIVLQPQLSKSGGAELLGKLRPISLISTSPHVLVVSSKLPVRTLQEFIDYAKSHPGTVNYASAGVGGVAHLGMAYLAAVTGTDMTHVPYRGTAAAVADLASGQVQALFSSYPSLQAAIDKGLVRALGMSAKVSAGPAAKLPVIASVVPGFEFTTWYALYAPAATPTVVVDRLNAAVRKVVANPALEAKLEVQGIELVANSPQEMQQLAKLDSDKWAKEIQRARIKVD
jgi:tripartite-type tricarboxylate transporter receptor subunit TctC